MDRPAEETKHEAAIRPVPDIVEDGVLSDERPARRIWRGLLWCEWFAQSKLMLGFIAAWLTLVWTLPLFAHPGWILLFGIVYAAVAGPAFGGDDTLEGCEEHSFSLPATRADRYRARLLVGGGSVALVAVLDLLVLGLDIPQLTARLFIDTGLVAARPRLEMGLLGGLVGVLPLTVFSFAFALAANARSRSLVLTSGFWGLLAALIILRLGLWYEKLRWDAWNGYASQILMLIAAAGALWIGHRQYSRKEIGRHFGRLVIPGHWWLWLLTFVIATLLAVVVIGSFIREFQQYLN